MSSRICALALLLFGPAAAAAQGPTSEVGPLPLKHVAEPTAPEITAGDLMTRLYIFADDSMQGREAGAIGNVKGTEYIASELRRFGVAPAGENGTYFQTIPLMLVAFDTASSFAIGGRPLRAFEDYVPLSRESVREGSLPIVFGGSVGTEAPGLTHEQAAGKLVVVNVPGEPSFRMLRRTPTIAGAVAVALVTGDDALERLGAFSSRPRAIMDEGGEGGASPALFLLSRSAASHLFARPLDELAPGATGGTASLDVRWSRKPAENPGRNVVGIVRGSDPALVGEYVAIGAHTDHIGFSQNPVAHDSLRIWNHVVRPEGADSRGAEASVTQQAEVDSMLAAYRSNHPGPVRVDSIDNGADDDGSGTVSALEVAENIVSMQPKPKRSLLFVFHVGEEKGLLGSRYFTDHPTVPRDSIVAQLNMDMVGRGGANDETGRSKDGQVLHGGPGYVQLVGSRRLSTELGELVEQVNREDGHGLTFDYAMDADGHPSNIYCRSDHYEYARYGIPVTFFTTGLHSDYHQVTDEPEYIDYGHMARIARLVEDVAVHVANLDHRIAVDQPKPDPSAACRQ